MTGAFDCSADDGRGEFVLSQGLENFGAVARGAGEYEAGAAVESGVHYFITFNFDK